MGIATFRSVGADDDPSTLASAGARRTLAVLIVAMRVSSGAVGAAVALAGMAPPARPGLVVAASLGILVWSGLFALWVLRRGPSPVLIYLDVLVILVLLLAHPWLVPAQVRAVSAGTGWIDIVAGVTLLIAQFGLRQPIGLLAGFLIAAAYAVGDGIVAVYAVGDGRLREAPVHLAVVALIGAGLMTMFRRAVESADAALAEVASQRQTAIVRAAIRSDERDHQRRLHDTVLATLTMVHTGGIASDSVALRDRAAADLAIIESMRDGPPGGVDSEAEGRPMVRLDLMLRFTAVTPAPAGTPLDVSVDVAPIELPSDVATAISQCVAEALTNVARHAGTGEADLAGRPEGEGASVIVKDNGVGFDVNAVPAHRRGLRESIEGRMRSVGGSASIQSGPGSGTQVVLRWPDV